jgi:LysM repeat protein
MAPFATNEFIQTHFTMMAKCLNPLVLFLSFFLSQLSQAQTTLFLTLSPGCADELEYLQASTGLKSRAYSLNFSNEQYVFFTTESGVIVASVPPGATGCRDLRLDQNLVDAVNSGLQQMTIVRQLENKTYQLLPVTSAMQVIKSGTYYVIRDKEYVLALDTTRLVYESNLAGPGSAGNVFLTGLKVYDCRVLYAFRSEPAEQKGEETHFDFAPGIGLASMSQGVSPSALQYSRIDLVRVNGYELADYITQLCGGPVAPPTPGGQPPTSTSGVKYHTVEAGEGLSSISRKYNVPVNTLMAWNKLSNPNMIKKGQQLIVSDPNNSDPVLPGVPSKPGVVGGGSGVGGQPNANQKTYTVKAGEKLVDVAARFGYTEAYFRKINGLPAKIELAAGTEVVASDCACARNMPSTSSTGAQTPTQYNYPASGAPYGNNNAPTVANQNAQPTPEPYTEVRFTEYTVKQGDTMASLATRYKVDVKELAYLNSKTVDEKLYPGQKLYIPMGK